MRVPFSYLDRQFEDLDSYLDDVRALVRSGQLTLGPAVEEFERRFAALCGLPHAVGVASGTDALMLTLKALGVGAGDEVITAANTFIATVGAIAMIGARPVLVDSTEGFTIDPRAVEAAVTPRTRAIVPVHYAGNVADMPAVMAIAARHGLAVVEDACQCIGGARDDQVVGSWGEAACFSLHPLKNLNVWGDGGVVVTRSADLDRRLRLLRNHGLVGRDEAVMFGHNSRLDALQAVVGTRLMRETAFITNRRIANARRLDDGLADLAPYVRVPAREPHVRHVFHLYMVRVDRRDELLETLRANGVEAKVHYPVPVHLQPAARHLGYTEGDCPRAEADSGSIITLPAHQHLTDEELDYVVDRVRAFYQPQ